jgi:T1SS-143 domain-containing protein
MTNNVELDGNSASRAQHEMRGGHDEQPLPLELAQAASPDEPAPNAAQPATTHAEPVPVDVGTPAAQTGQQAPAQAAAAHPAASGEYAAGTDNVVHLPANTSIDNIRVDGANLVLQQADGSVIVIKDGAINVPSFIIGDVEVPRVALLAALESNGVNVAFGADGSISAGSAAAQHESAGGNFEQPAGGIGNGFGLSALLPPTELRFGQLDRHELYPAVANREPHLADFAANPVSEEGLSGGNKDSSGSNDTTDATHITGVFPATDPDGDALSFIFGEPSGLLSGGLPVAWAGQGTGSLVGSVNGAPVITIMATGDTYTIELLGPIDHPNDARPGSEDDLTLVVPVTVTDGNGDSATANMSITIEDDSPSISATGAGAALQVDETALATDAQANFAAAFTSSYGADGAGTIAYALHAVAGASGLTDTATGEAVNLVQNGTTVEGRTAGSNALVFTLTVDGSGNVTLDQQRAVVHPNTANPNDAVSLTAADLVTLTAMITDKDGDSQTATLNIGQNLSFLHEGPPN